MLIADYIIALMSSCYARNTHMIECNVNSTEKRNAEKSISVFFLIKVSCAITTQQGGKTAEVVYFHILVFLEKDVWSPQDRKTTCEKSQFPFFCICKPVTERYANS